MPLRRHLPGAGSALAPLEQGLLVNACNFMTDRVEEYELKALECETIASSLAADDDPLRRIYQDLATKWRHAPFCRSTTSKWMSCLNTGGV